MHQDVMYDFAATWPESATDQYAIQVDGHWGVLHLRPDMLDELSWVIYSLCADSMVFLSMAVLLETGK